MHYISFWKSYFLVKSYVNSSMVNILEDTCAFVVVFLKLAAYLV